jgi:hypothetical protein
MQRRLKIPMHFTPSASQGSSAGTAEVGPSVVFTLGAVVLTLLSYLHVALYELFWPSNPDFRHCLPYKSDIAGCVVAFLSLFVWMWALVDFRRVWPSSHMQKLVRATIFIYWGAFLNMAVNPETWPLSFRSPGCYNNFDGQTIGRVSLASYALLLSGALETLDLVRKMYKDCPNVYLFYFLCGHIATVTFTCYIAREL